MLTSRIAVAARSPRKDFAEEWTRMTEKLLLFLLFCLEFLF